MCMNAIRKLLRGNEEVLEQVIRDLYPKVYSYIYHRMNDAVLAKDLTQETFYQFFAHLEEYEERGKMLNYLYRIALHQVYDYAKGNKNPALELQEDTLGDTTYDGHQMFLNQENFVALHSWIRKLPYHLQDVILLRYEEELKYKDIAEIIGKPISTVKSQVKQAIDLLEEQARMEGYK